MLKAVAATPWSFASHRRLRSPGSALTSFRAPWSSAAFRSEVEKSRAQQLENERWAKEEPRAREVLAQPPLEEGGAAVTPGMLDSLEDYLQARRWHHPDGPARRFLSHLLTFPLTLAAGLHEAGLASPVRKGDARPGNVHRDLEQNPTEGVLRGRHVTVACVGARAESSLPPAFWRETLFALPSVSRLELHLIGPEVTVPSGVAPTSAGARTKAGGGEGGEEVGIHRNHPLVSSVHVGERVAEISWTRAVIGRKGGASMVADETSGQVSGSAANSGVTATAVPLVAEAAESAIARADVFVLFNPGLGHPHLREGWEGALKRLLMSGKPIVVSCHSRLDLDRDARRIRDIAKRCRPGWADAGRRGADVFPRKNAFGSLMTAEDPLSRPGAEEIVSSNWGLLVVAGASWRQEL